MLFYCPLNADSKNKSSIVHKFLGIFSVALEKDLGLSGVFVRIYCLILKPGFPNQSD